MSQATSDKTIDDILLDQGVEMRQQFLVNMMPGGKLPEDPKDRALILKAIDGIDKTAISRKRIKIEDRTAANQEKVAGLLAHVFKNVGGNKNPFRITDEQVVESGQMTDVPMIPAHLANINLVEGETAVNPRQGSYEDFTSNNELPPVENE